MAILKGFNNRIRGSFGNVTFRQKNGKTIISERITSSNGSKTPAQQRHRMKWSNIVKMYKGLIPIFECAFENKADGISDYNMFVKANIDMQPVYLTKEESAGGACVVAPYIITQGSLRTIMTSGTGANCITDIALGSPVIDQTTTIAEFANAIVQNNLEYNYYDKIEFIHIEQQVNGATNLPYGIFKRYGVVLDKLNAFPLLACVPAEGFTTIDGCLGHLPSAAGDYAYAWVHSRKSSGKTLVSSQSLIDNNSLLPQYTSEEAYRRAVETYGGEHDKLL